MPTGVIINSLSIVLGGIFGALLGHKLSHRLKTEITLIFGICAMAMGINAIGLMENMPAVIFSIIIGTIVGLSLHFSDWINKGAILMQKPIAKIFKNNGSDLSSEEFQSTLITIIVLFCASGTGIYGESTPSAPHPEYLWTYPVPPESSHEHPGKSLISVNFQTISV